MRLQRNAERIDNITVCPPEASSLAQVVADANARALEFARARLARRFPPPALARLNTYFADTAVHVRGDDQALALEWPIERLLRELCTRVHSVVSGMKAQGLQIGILSRGEAIDLDTLGERAEPSSDLYLLDPRAVQRAAAENASVEVRVLDRHFAEWGQVSDDIAAVSGAEIFMKLFVAGGKTSVNNWHRDASDVLVTILDGSKQFQVGTIDSPDDTPITEVDVVLRPGDALLLPRFRLHNATPTGEVSALLSVGLMRHADWSYRHVVPTHLGLASTRSPRLYRLALRARIPPTWGSGSDSARFRTRTPGGLAIAAQENATVVFVAAGRQWKSEADVLAVMAAIHGSDGVTSAELSTITGYAEEWCTRVAYELAAHALVHWE